MWKTDTLVRSFSVIHQLSGPEKRAESTQPLYSFSLGLGAELLRPSWDAEHVERISV